MAAPQIYDYPKSRILENVDLQIGYTPCRPEKIEISIF